MPSLLTINNTQEALIYVLKFILQIVQISIFTLFMLVVLLSYGGI